MPPSATIAAIIERMREQTTMYCVAHAIAPPKPEKKDPPVKDPPVIVAFPQQEPMGRHVSAFQERYPQPGAHGVKDPCYKNRRRDLGKIPVKCGGRKETKDEPAVV